MTGISNENQLKFNSIKDAKQLLEAVEKRFGRNAATKKTQRNLLKQQYEKLTASSSEMPGQTFDRLQKLVSQLELLDEKLSLDDVNQKLLRSLSPEWNTYVVVWRNKADLYTMSMHDLYNNLKVYEPEVKGMSSSRSSTQNMAFVSSSNNNTSSTNRVVNTAQAVNTANEVSTASTQVNASYSTNIVNLSDAVICALFTSQPNSPQLIHEDLECKALRNQDNNDKESSKRSVPIETSTSIALVLCDSLSGYDWSDQAEEGPNYVLMDFSSSSSGSEKIFLLKNMDQDSAHMVAASKVPMLTPGVNREIPITIAKEKAQRRNKADLDTMSMDDLYNNLKVYELKVKGMSSSNSNTQNMAFLSLTNSSTNGEVNTANGVSTASTQVNDAFSTNIDNLSDVVICAFLASQPNNEFVVKPIVENKSSEEETKAVRKNNDGLIIKEPSIVKKEFVKPRQREKTIKKTVKKVENNRQNIHRPKGNQRNWNNIMSQKLGSNFEMFNKACYGNLQIDLQDKRVIDSGCSSHMTRNMSYLTDYEEIDRGYVAFGGNPKRGKITRKCTIKTDLKSSYNDGSKPSSDDGKKVDEDPSKESEYNDQEKEDNVNNINNVNTDSSTVNAAGTNEVKADGRILSSELSFDLNMPALEDVSIFNFSSDDEDDGAMDDMNNLDTTIQEQPKKVIHALKDLSWIEAMQEELLQFKNKKDERRIVIRNKARLVAQGYTQEKEIDYDEVFAHIARIKAISLLLAYALFKDFMVYQMDVKSAFLYGKIKKEVYVCQPLGFEDPDFPDRVYKVKKYCKEYIKLLDLDLKSSHNDGSKPSSDDGKKVDEDPRKESEYNDQEKEDNVNNINNVNTVSSTVNAAGTNEVKVDGGILSSELSFDLNMPALEDVSIFNFSSDDEDDDHPLDQVIGDLHLATQTRKMSKNLKEHGNKKDERRIVIRNKARLVAQGYTQEKEIDYDEVFAPVARIKAISLLLAYALFKDFMVYQMDVKSAFLYGKIKEEVYVCQPPGFEDPDFPDRVYKVKKHCKEYIKLLDLDEFYGRTCILLRIISETEEGWHIY
nr:putative ribonuclease H-like domain-containing protein [Tanacetum cinerariifolium]